MSLGTALVTGGCGCVGYHVVKALLAEPTCTAVHVISRNPTRSRLSGAQYHAGDLTVDADLRRVLDAVQPDVIFHVASPVSSGNDASQTYFYEAIVDGTKRLIDHAVNARCVRALVYTSSSSVVQGPYKRVDETRALLDRASGTNYYSYSKACADALVLKSNDPEGMRTVCLRISGIYGDRDNQMLPGLLKVLNDQRQKTQLGNNSTLFDFCSANNAAGAHVLAAKRLLSGITDSQILKVDGEAFFITDDKPIPFWDFSRKVWAEAGSPVDPKTIRVIPAWLILSIALTVEWVFWIATFGQKTPKFLRSHTIRWVTEERTFSIEKAKTRLNYQPRDRMDEDIAKGVRWCLQTKGEKSS